MTSAQGEDRSDFNAVLPPVDSRGNKLDFVFFKASEGIGWISQTYARNVALARRYGVPHGSYHFLHPSLDIEAQVSLFMSVVIKQGLEPGDMLAADSEILSGKEGHLYLSRDRSNLLERNPLTGAAVIREDVQYPHNFVRHGSPTRLGKSAIDFCTLEFLTGVHEAQRAHLGGDYCQVINYSEQSVARQLVSCIDYPLWIAWFDNTPPTSEDVSPWTDWTLWQYGDGGGNGNSDQDAFNGTAEWFNAWRTAKMPKYVTPPPVVRQMVKEHEMIIVKVTAPTPAPSPAPSFTGTRTYLYTSDGCLEHIVSGTDEAAFAAALPVVEISWNQYVELGGK